MIKKSKTIILLLIILNIFSCQVYLAPTTYQCMDIDALYKYRKEPIGTPGMTHLQFRHAYKKSKHGLSYDDTIKTQIYLKHNECPIWLYRFDKGRLVSRGYLVQEMGFWSYSETNFEETVIIKNAILDDQFNLIGVKIRKKEPVYNNQGELIGVKETWLGDEMK